MLFLGIDPGQKGAAVALRGNGSTVYLCKFDGLDPLKVIEFYRPGEIISVILEQVHAMPGQGVSSMFNFGVGYGRLQGFLTGRGIAFQLVPPQTWQAWLPPLEDPKERARAYAAEAWGLERFIGAGCRVPHQGMIDAACMAEYGRRLHLGLVTPPAARTPRKKLQPIKL